MSPPGNPPCRLRALPGDRDAGVTLLEVMVAMGIMSVVMAMATSAVITIHRAAARTESVSIAQSQLAIAFGRFDAEIRYASGISMPTDSPHPYVEYLLTYDGTPRCTQLRVKTDATVSILQSRSWQPGSTPGADWNTVANNVTLVAGRSPFVRTTPGASSPFQRLRLLLEVAVGEGAVASRKRTDVEFTALNTSLSTKSDTLCAHWRPAS